MGLFSGITKGVGDLLGGKQQTFTPQVAGLNQELFNQYQQDIGGVRSLANTPVTGMNASGIAAADYATQMYNQQLNQMGMQGQSGLASSMANLNRYGADSGAQERMGRQNMMAGLMGQQNLGATHATNLANIGQRNIAQQEQQRYNALMQLPSMQQGAVQMQYGADLNSAQAANDAALANMGAQAARRQGIGNSLGTIGQIGGAAFGGPIGSLAGGVGGNLLGGLFS